MTRPARLTHAEWVNAVNPHYPLTDAAGFEISIIGNATTLYAGDDGVIAPSKLAELCDDFGMDAVARAVKWLTVNGYMTIQGAELRLVLPTGTAPV